MKKGFSYYFLESIFSELSHSFWNTVPNVCALDGKRDLIVTYLRTVYVEITSRKRTGVVSTNIFSGVKKDQKC